MANTRSMTRNQNRKRVKNCDNSGVAPWADLGHDVLFLVMMQLGVIDFLAFSGVCKSWRSFALDNKKIFMESKPPMLMSISDVSCKKEWYCYLEDLTGRKYRTIIPHYAGRICVGITCGYLILFGGGNQRLLACESYHKGNIYTLNIGGRVYEMIFNPKPKFTLLRTNNFPSPVLSYLEFLSSSKNLYVIDWRFKDSHKVHELDIEEMKWVSSGKTFEECAFFINSLKYYAATKSKLWVDHRPLYYRYACFLATIDTIRQREFLPSNIWYCPDDCLNVNLLDE